MGLKPQDILVGLKIVSIQDQKDWSYQGISAVLGLSASETHASVKRLISSKLLDDFGNKSIFVNPENFYEYIRHGIKYHYPPELSGIVEGIDCSINVALAKNVVNDQSETNPEAHLKQINQPLNNGSYVWAHSGGNCHGIGLTPLYKSVPFAALKCEKLHKLMSLVEVMRTAETEYTKEFQACDRMLLTLLKPDNQVSAAVAS